MDTPLEIAFALDAAAEAYVAAVDAYAANRSARNADARDAAASTYADARHTYADAARVMLIDDFGPEVADWSDDKVDEAVAMVLQRSDR